MTVSTFISVAQSVAFQRDLRFELFTAQITKVTSFCVVSVHVSLQVAPAAACVVAHSAGIWLQACTYETIVLKDQQHYDIFGIRAHQ